MTVFTVTECSKQKKNICFVRKNCRNEHENYLRDFYDFYPNLIKIDDKGFYSMDYLQLVPISIKNLQIQKVEALKYKNSKFLEIQIEKISKFFHQNNQNQVHYKSIVNWVIFRTD